MTSGGPPYPFGQGPGGYGPPPPRRPTKLIGFGVALAVVLSAAALIVGVIALVRQPGTAVTATPPSSSPATPVGDTSAADKALCKEVGPLLREVVDEGKRFVALGDPGTPERDSGIPAFRRAIEDWATRIQPILDNGSASSPYLKRTLQTEVDFKQLYATNIRPGPEQITDAQAWNIAAIAHGGPWEVCHALGVTW